MSKKYRNFDYNRNNQNKNEISNTEVNQEEVIEEVVTDTSVEETQDMLLDREEVVTDTSVEETQDMLLDREEVEKVLQEKIENIIESKKEEIKKNSEKVFSSLVKEKGQKEFVVDMKDFVSTSLLTYYENMNNTVPVNHETAARWNYSLFNVFKEVLNKPLEDFKKDWNTILKFFNQYKDTCFRHELIYRGPQYWPGSEKEFEMYRTLAFIAIETADVNTRSSAIKDMKNLEDKFNIFTEEQRNKLISFYF